VFLPENVCRSHPNNTISGEGDMNTDRGYFEDVFREKYEEHTINPGEGKTGVEVDNREQL
jgi:hypothetical protein